jgi:branched-chain amino acid transport system substrate-binding protein
MGKRKFAAIMLVFTVILLAGFTNSNAAGDGPQIACVGPFTGEGAQYGSFFKKGAEVALEIVNSEGGINKKSLQIQYEDDKLSPQESTFVASKLCKESKTLAVVGHLMSTQNLAAVPIYKKCELVTINFTATDPKLSGASPFWFRNVITTEYMDAVLAKYAIDQWKPKSVAILYLLSDATMANAEDFKKLMEGKGVKVVAFESHQPNEKEFVGTLTKIQPLNPDFIFIASLYTEASMIIKQAREMGMKTQFLGMEALYNPRLPELAGSGSEGTVSIGYFHPAMGYPKTKEFVDRFIKKYNEDPESLAIGAADGVFLAAAALRKYGENRGAIKKYLEGLTEKEPFMGIAGPISFSKSHDLLSKPMAMLKVEQGKWKFIGVGTP